MKRIAQPVFTAGHILTGIIDVLTPVKRDTTDNITRKTAAALITNIETGLRISIKIVIMSTSRPMNINVNPSLIQDMVIMSLLSLEISPKPLTIAFVGYRCPIPHKVITIEPIYKNTVFAILFSFPIFNFIQETNDYPTAFFSAARASRRVESRDGRGQSSG